VDDVITSPLNDPPQISPLLHPADPSRTIEHPQDHDSTPGTLTGQLFDPIDLVFLVSRSGWICGSGNTLVPLEVSKMAS